ncbi:MAG: zinc ribbon domain-containing protein [Candidatus Zixiibacteriota bacterium]
MTKDKVDKILDSLFSMQELDVKIAELEVSKVYKPKLLDELKGKVEKLENAVNSIDKKLNNIAIREKETELDIDKIRETYEKAKKKLSMVTSNREYEAVQDEIMENEELLALKEEEELKILDEQEETKKEKAKLDDEYEKTKIDAEKQIEQIESELSHVEENIAALEKEREQYISDVPKRLMAKYNRVRRGLGNLAVVHVTKRACGGCFQTLPPQTIQDLIRGDKIITCPSCGRILAWDEEDGRDG